MIPQVEVVYADGNRISVSASDVATVKARTDVLYINIRNAIRKVIYQLHSMDFYGIIADNETFIALEWEERDTSMLRRRFDDPTHPEQVAGGIVNVPSDVVVFEGGYVKSDVWDLYIPLMQKDFKGE